MAETIGHAQIVVEIEDRVGRELAAIQKDVERRMRDIGDERAMAEIDVDVSRFEDGVKNAKRELRVLQGQRAEARLDADKKALDRKIAEARAQIARLDGQKAEVEIELKGDREFIRAQQKLRQIAQREAALIERAERARVRAQIAGLREMERASRAAQRTLNDTSLALNEQQSELIRTNLETYRTEQQVRRLQIQYVELVRTLDNLRRAQRRTRAGSTEQAFFDLKIEDVVARIRNLQERGQLLRIDLRPNLVPGADFGSHIRRMGHEFGLRGAAFAFGATLADNTVRGFRARFNPRAIGASVARGFGRVGDWFGRLGDLKFNVGPFVGSLKLLAGLVTVFAPLVADLVGALGALGAVAGSASLGMGALGSAIVAGAIPALIGMATVLTPVIRGTSEALSIATRYNGEIEDGSKAQRRFNRILAGTSQATRDSFEAAGRISSVWRTLTRPSRISAFDTIGKGLRIVTDNLPRFASLTNRTMDAATSSVNRWLTGIRNDLARDGGVFSTVWDNFNAGLRPFLDGLGDIGAYFGRVAAAASRYLPRMGQGFRDWAARLLDTTNDAEGFQGKIDRIVQSASRVGNMFLSAGRFVKSFFSAGVEGGEDLVDSITRTLDSWTDFNNSVEGRQALKDFFSQSVDGARALFNAIVPVAKTFGSWAIELAPTMATLVTAFGHLGSAISSVFGVLNSFFRSLTDIVGLSPSLGTLAATLATLWGVGKIRAATTAVLGFGKALLGLKVGGAVAGILGGVVGGAAGRRGGGLKEAARDAGLLASALGGLGTGAAANALPRIALGALRVAGPLGLVVGASVALNEAFENLVGSSGPGMKTRQFIFEIDQLSGRTGISLRSLAGGAKDAATGVVNAVDFMFDGFSDADDKAGDFTEWMEEAGRVSDDAKTNFFRARDAVEQVGRAQAQSNLSLRAAKQALDGTRRGTLEYEQALLNYRDALAQNAQTEAAWAKAKRSTFRTAADAVKIARLEYERLQEAFADGLATQRDVEVAFARLQARLNAQAAVAANNARAYRGMVKATGEAEQALGRLARMGNRRLATRIAIRYENPQDAGRVAAAASRAIRAGARPTIVTRIVADSRNADQAIRRINNVRMAIKNVRFAEQGGRRVVQVAQDIAGYRMPPKIVEILQRGGPAAQRILDELIATHLPGKTQNINERGGKPVKSLLDAIRSLIIPDKDFTVSAFDNASGTLNTIRSLLASITSKTVTVTVLRVGSAIRDSFAEGKSAGRSSPNAIVGEGSRWQGAREAVVNRRTGSSFIVDRPTGVELGSDDYVIPLEEYRSRGRDLLRRLARDLGMATFAGGRRPRVSMRGGIRGPGPQNLPAVLDFWRSFKLEDDQNREISIAESRVRAPDSFIKVVREDKRTGEVEYAVDEAAVTAYEGRLREVEDLYNTLIRRIVPVIRRKGRIARNSLAVYQDRRRKQVTDLERRLAAQKRKLNKNKANRNDDRRTKERKKARREAAQQAIQDITGKIREQRGLITDAYDEDVRVRDEERQLDFRTREYRYSRDDIRDERVNVRPTAEGDARASSVGADEAGGSGGSGGGSGGDPNDAGTPAERTIASLQSELALSDAGLGGRDRTSILNDLKTAWTSRMSEARALLTDRDPSNDISAWNTIAQAANEIRAINDQIADASANVAQQFMALGTARQDLYSNFANNFTMAAGFNQMGQVAGRQFASSFGPSSGLTRPEYGYAGGSPGQKNITFNQTFNQMPDPHTWSQGAAWELQTSVL